MALLDLEAEDDGLRVGVALEGVGRLGVRTVGLRTGVEGRAGVLTGDLEGVLLYVRLGVEVLVGIVGLAVVRLGV